MKKKFYIFVIIGILLAFSIMFCIHIKKQENLDNWIGEYYYSEIFPHNSGELFYFIEYTIIIYKDGNKYYAQITGDGWHTMVRMLAQVTGDRDKIEITYLQLLPDGMFLRFDGGEVLWRFERDGSDINTVWLESRVLHPYLSDMDGEIIRRSFEKVTDESLSEEAEISDVWEERDGSGVPAEKGDQLGDAEEDVTTVCDMVRTMDFTVEKPHLELTEEEDLAYKEAFLRMLKNEICIKGYPGGDYYEDLWLAGIPYEVLLEKRNSTDFVNGCCYYYDDVDGDGKPELGVKQGCVYFFDYELGEEMCSVSYGEQRTYFEQLIGVGKIWEQDIQHAGWERNRYVVLNSVGEWETVLEFEYGYHEPKYYLINGVDVGKENWEELIALFYEATEYEIPSKTMTEVFGELLEVD